MNRKGYKEEKKASSGSYGAYSRKRKKAFAPQYRVRIVWRRFLPTILLAGIFLFSLIKIILYADGCVSRKRTAKELNAVRNAVTEQTEPTAPPVPVLQTLPPGEVKPALLDTYQYIGEEMLESSKELYKKNKDYVAWVQIPGVVSLPVVYRDNTYYLDHDFNGKKNSGGTLFLDEYHPFKADTQYLVLHGHNMHDGTMFGLLSHYRKRDYIEQHPTVYFTTLYQKEEYKVVAVLILPADANHPDYIAYTGNRKFYTVSRFTGFVNDLASKSLYWAEGEELLPSDALLSLSTCYENDRIVLMCKRVKP